MKMYKTGGEDLIEEIEVEKIGKKLIFVKEGEFTKAFPLDDKSIKYHKTKEAAKEHLLEQAKRNLQVSQMKVYYCEERIKEIEKL